ncbi:leucine-rich repeat-containing protein 69-like [Corticium candelabrum]|uniref:leucine-rich repeat-containing protein 69-like n=1 Tax=Corticium candelabrum TaxID=121492 RepID=UPI002E258561|nr:leucine-rich repeat-containing protein 69-like [Corticium candelabrum]
MSDLLLLNASKTRPKSINLASRRLDRVPALISKLQTLQSVSFKNNSLTSLCDEITHLKELTSVNLGNNHLSCVPDQLSFLPKLNILHLFGNHICELAPNVVVSLQGLTLLNLNDNLLTFLPSQISSLGQLQWLSLARNQLTVLPPEIGRLNELRELNVSDNLLTLLPDEISHLKKLKKLYLQKNKLPRLNHNIEGCVALLVVDVSVNELVSFPYEIKSLSLNELYCEANPLLQELPVSSEQEDEVLCLREAAARIVLKSLKDRTSRSRVLLKFHPELRKSLAAARKCAVCRESFLNTWLECVQFVSSRKVLGVKNNAGVIPLRVLLCSYRCFNVGAHNYYGVALP